MPRMSPVAFTSKHGGGGPPRLVAGKRRLVAPYPCFPEWRHLRIYFSIVLQCTLLSVLAQCSCTRQDTPGYLTKIRKFDKVLQQLRNQFGTHWLYIRKDIPRCSQIRAYPNDESCLLNSRPKIMIQSSQHVWSPRNSQICQNPVWLMGCEGESDLADGYMVETKFGNEGMIESCTNLLRT